MRLRPLWFALLVLSVALAGCTDESADQTSPEPTAPTGSPTPAPIENLTQAAKEAAGRYVPWTLSDHWTYTMEVRGMNGSQETELVYYQEAGPEYVVGTPTYAEALHHAVFSVNPILGRIHQGHLAPHERGEHAEMFPFVDGQIQDGKQWVTVFYARQLALTATYDPAVPTPNGTAPGYRIAGTDAGGDFDIAYDYVPQVKWFTRLTATDSEGTVIDLRLTDHGTGYSGPAHFIRAKTLFEEPITTDTVPASKTFTIDPDLVERKRVEGFAIHADIQSGGTLARLSLKDPDGNEIWSKNHDDGDGIDEIWPQGEKPSGPIDERPQWPAGTYTFEFLSIGKGRADVILVGTQDNSGSV